MLTVIGVVLLLAAVVLVFDIGGAGRWVIRNLTSKSLGDLAPGYAASPIGLKIYAAILGSIGLIFTGLDVAASYTILGLVAMIVGVTVFVVASILAIRGEIATYRELKR